MKMKEMRLARTDGRDEGRTEPGPVKKSVMMKKHRRGVDLPALIK